MPVPRLEFTLSEGGHLWRSLRYAVAADEWDWREFEVGVETDTDIFPANIATVDGFYIESDAAVTYAVNSSATATTLDANSFHIVVGTNVTALTITNASGTANIKLGTWGT